MTTNAEPVLIYRSNYATRERDLADLVALIEEDDTGGLKKPNPEAIRRAMESNDAILVRDTDINGTLRAGSVLYYRGKLADGRELYEYGSVTARRCPGYNMLPMMSRIFTSRMAILKPQSMIIGVVRFDNQVQNHSSLHQLRKAGYVLSGGAMLEAVTGVRKLDPGREVLLFDPANACIQARRLQEVVDGVLIPNKVPEMPALYPSYRLSPISNGMLERYIELTCKKPCRLVG